MSANPRAAVTSAEPVNNSPASMPASQSTINKANAMTQQRSTSKKIFGIGRVQRSQSVTAPTRSTECRSDATTKNRKTMWATRVFSTDAGKMAATASGTNAAARRRNDPHDKPRRPRGAESKNTANTTTAITICRLDTMSVHPEIETIAESNPSVGITLSCIPSHLNLVRSFRALSNAYCEDSTSQQQHAARHSRMRLPP